jgi:hypothetical protein
MTSAVVAFVFVLALVGLWTIVKKIKEFFDPGDPMAQDSIIPCVHGHENWDACPVCGH